MMTVLQQQGILSRPISIVNILGEPGVSKLSGIDEMEDMSGITGIKLFLKLALIVTMDKQLDGIP